MEKKITLRLLEVFKKFPDKEFPSKEYVVHYLEDWIEDLEFAKKGYHKIINADGLGYTIFKDKNGNIVKWR